MIEDVLKYWLTGVHDDLVANYDRLGLRASGDWANSLEQFQIINDTKITVGMKGNDYTEYLENGRRPNANKSKEAIRAWVGWAGSTVIKKWCQEKGVDISPYAVAYKIAREGWKVPNKNNAGGLVSDVVTRERVELLAKNLCLYKIDEFKQTFAKA